MPKTRKASLEFTSQSLSDTSSKNFGTRLQTANARNSRLNKEVSPYFPTEGEVDESIARQTLTEAAVINSSSKKTVKTNVSITQKSTKPPTNWEEVYQSIKEYRKTLVAPVDVMGCERLAEEPSKEITPQTSRFQSLVALMLSSQTKDQVTAAAIHELRQKLSGGLNLKSVLQADEEYLDQCISKVGFHRKKAKYMKQVAEICQDKYSGDIPNTVEELMKLPGVGPKMAYLCMNSAWKQNEGIGVDVHVHRITNRLGWCKTEKAGPEGTRQALESWLPRNLWQEINPMLVGFGQTTCLPRMPKCTECPVKDKCPSSGKKS
ncbi:12639_t:CDS:2 [Acaulospora morrowiae]|uniref:Endonuclease III homolog n=1 Tax=Acaulospora morrowiae TaxID=94023 RepID=A0A9N8VQZ5_9GLOM|nr:12639_t:CDS:2 [Acaulospora morrowiae]